MATTRYDVLGVGNAIVDVIARADEAFHANLHDRDPEMRRAAYEGIASGADIIAAAADRGGEAVEPSGRGGDIARGVATARRLPEFESQVTQLEQRLENLKQVLPEEKDVADILRRIQGLATQSNLAIQRTASSFENW